MMDKNIDLERLVTNVRYWKDLKLHIGERITDNSTISFETYEEIKQLKKGDKKVYYVYGVSKNDTI